MDKHYRFIVALVVMNVILLALIFNINIKLTDTLKKVERISGHLVGIEDQIKDISGKLWLKY